MISALVLAQAFVLVLTACGGLITYHLFPRWSTLLERTVVRCVLGTVTLPLLIIAAHEILGLSVRPSIAVVVAISGGFLTLADERRFWSRSSPRQLATRLASRDEALVAVMALGVMLSCFTGSSRYPMFEGRDPWGHLLGVRYILETGALRQPFTDWPVLHYIDGYPPLYDLFLAMPASLAPSLNLSAKATNSLLVGLVNLVVFFLVCRLSRNRAIAMTATVLYVVLPGNLTRQIWGHSLALVLVLGGLLCAVRCRSRRRWLLPGALCFCGALLAAPTQGIKGGMLLVLTTCVASAVSRRWASRLLLVGAIAASLSLLWFLPLLLRVDSSPQGVFSSMDHPTLRRTGIRWKGDPASRLEAMRAALLGSGHSATNVDDFLFVRPHDFMRRWYPTKALGNIVPQGLGVSVSFLVLAFVVSIPVRWLGRRRRRFRLGWREIAAVWLLFSLAGVLGWHLGFGFFVWRFWLLLCPFACLAAAERIIGCGRAWSRNAAARTILTLSAALAVGQALLCISWRGESLLWRLIPLNPAFLLVPSAVAVWLGITRVRPAALGVRRRAFSVMTIVIVAHVIVAAPARVRALTAFVKPSIFHDPVEYTGYARLMDKTPRGAAVFPLSDGDHCSAVVALDRTCRPWGLAERELREQLLMLKDPPEVDSLVERLQEQGYTHVIADPSFRRLAASRLGDREAAEYLQRLVDHSSVRPVLSASSDPPAPPSRFDLYSIAPPAAAGRQGSVDSRIH